jgi:hypothetical protein
MKRSKSKKSPILMQFSGDFNVQGVNILITRIKGKAGKVRGVERKIV